MKLTAALFVLLLIGIIAALAILGAKSRSDSAAQLLNDKLQRCPKRPNCICSEYPDDVDHFAAPITIDGRSNNQLGLDIRTTLNKMHGATVIEQSDYLAVSFTSKIFKFVDDFEIRIDTANQQLHLRSASRVGYSDRGVNRQRIEQFRQIFTSQTHNE